MVIRNLKSKKIRIIRVKTIEKMQFSKGMIASAMIAYKVFHNFNGFRVPFRVKEFVFAFLYFRCLCCGRLRICESASENLCLSFVVDAAKSAIEKP